MFSITVTPTVLKPEGIQHYLAVGRIKDVYEPVTAIARSHRDAVAACLVKVEVEMMKQARRKEGIYRQVTIVAMCQCEDTCSHEGLDFLVDPEFSDLFKE